MKLKFLLIGLIFFTVNSFAGNEFSGGHTILNNSSYELFEFYEFGISNRTSILRTEEDPGSFKKKFDQSHAIKTFGPEIEDLVIDKLNQIYKLSPEFAVQIFNLIDRYRWKLLDVKDEMVEPEDIGPSPIKYSELTLMPTALRLPQSKLIYVKKSIAELLEKSHLVGLIFHEALSDYVQTTNASSSGSEELNEERGTSVIARVLTTYLFSENFIEAKFSDLRHFMLKMGIMFYYTHSEQFPTNQKPRNYYKYSWGTQIPNAYFEFDFRKSRADSTIRKSLPLDIRRYTSYEDLNEVICDDKRNQLNNLTLSLDPLVRLIQKKRDSEINRLFLKYIHKANLIIKVSGMPIDSRTKPNLFCLEHYCNFYQSISKISIGSGLFSNFNEIYETVEIDWSKIINYSDFQKKSNFYRNFVFTNLTHLKNENLYKCFTWDEYDQATQPSLYSEVK